MTKDFSCPSCQTVNNKSKNYLVILIVPLFVVIFIFLNKFSFFSSFNLTADSSLFLFFFLGLLAGFSTCTALIGGLLLSLSSSWSNFKSHLIFNLSRIISFTILGSILGLIGNFLKLSPYFYSTVIILISLLMIYLSLRMFGLHLPQIYFLSKISKKIFKNNLSPILFGALSFLLPCGFTLTAQSLALVSSNPLKGALIMLFFVLGTVPSLLLIGFFSFKIYSYSRFSKIFSLIAAILILFFALFNLNSQFPILNYLKLSKNTSDIIIKDGKQIIKMSVSSSTYTPNFFKVKTNIPVVWEITGNNFSGCTDTIISSLFFNQSIKLLPQQTIIKEFVIINPGIYRFSCSMCMVSGTIQAIN